VVVPRAVDVGDPRAPRTRIAIVHSWVRRLREIPDQPQARPAGVCSRTRKRSLPPRRVVVPARTQAPAGWLSLRGKAVHPRPAARKRGRPGEQRAHLPAERLPHAKLPREVAAENHRARKPVRRTPELADRRGRALPSGRVERLDEQARGRVPRPQRAAHVKEPGKKPHPQLVLGEDEVGDEVEGAAEHEARRRELEKLEAPRENPPRAGVQRKLEGAPPAEALGHDLLAARRGVDAGKLGQQDFRGLWPT